MNVTRLAAWLRKLPSGTVRIQAIFPGIAGDEVIYTWELHKPKGEKSKEKTRLSDQDIAADILAELKADTERRNANCRYLIHAMDEADNILGTFVAKERHPDNRDPSDVDAEASINGIVTQVLRHNEGMVRMMLSAFQTIQDNYHGLLNIQANQITDMRAREKAMQEAMMEYTQHIDTEQLQKAESLQKVTEAVAQELIPRAGAFVDWYIKQPQKGEGSSNP